ncbi:MAG: Lrp/AsnC family transcriptional regulator [Cytophagales bacterium]|nr:Lrp/AsnC family transcriptional regulator [Cytophagales bacterium]
MDIVDAKIIELLMANSRISGADIARRVHLSLPAVTERLRKLSETGVIESYTVKLSNDHFDWRLKAFIKVWVDHELAENIVQAVTACPPVLECHHIAGDFDLLLKVLVKDTHELEYFLTKQLKVIKGISRTSTTIVLDTYVEKINRTSKDEPSGN